MNGDWHRVRDLFVSSPERAKAELDEDKRRIAHGAWGDHALFVVGCLMLAAVVVGVTTRLVF